jgi:hypothetical protein
MRPPAALRGYGNSSRSGLLQPGPLPSIACMVNRIHFLRVIAIENFSHSSIFQSPCRHPTVFDTILSPCRARRDLAGATVHRSSRDLGKKRLGLLYDPTSCSGESQRRRFSRPEVWVRASSSRTPRELNILQAKKIAAAKRTMESHRATGAKARMPIPARRSAAKTTALVPLMRIVSATAGPVGGGGPGLWRGLIVRRGNSLASRRGRTASRG